MAMEGLLVELMLGEEWLDRAVAAVAWQMSEFGSLSSPVAAKLRAVSIIVRVSKFMPRAERNFIAPVPTMSSMEETQCVGGPFDLHVTLLHRNKIRSFILSFVRSFVSFSRGAAAPQTHRIGWGAATPQPLVLNARLPAPRPTT